ncbi:unnamed protein product [Rotaria sp. Silwood1]|nr:unnamed protein product [Rotaria sp. Silwood1]CAF5075895.1 unnamed protein product [Rotaria sp. Silwood1]
MAQANYVICKSKPLIPREVLTTSDQLNSGLPPNQQPIQHEGTSYVNKTDYSNKHIRTCETTKDHHKLPMKIKYRISSSMSSINNTQINKEANISIDLLQYKDSQTTRTSSQFATTDNINNSTSLSFQRINSQRKRTSHLIENSAELTRECAICLLDQPIYFFEGHYSNKCKHSQRTICDTCIYNNIKYIIENTINRNLFCPEPNCMAILNFESIRYILSMGNNFELFERYDRQLTHKHLEQIQEFVWCAHNGCGSGQLHYIDIYKNPIVTCIKCKKQTCAYHRVKWHIGMTCQEYDQSNISSIDHNTQIWIRKYSKKCPLCHSFIEKISGCDHMTCTICKHQFCWQCFADYRKIQTYGRKQHMIYCTHYSSYPHSNNHFYRQRSVICTIL